MANYALAQLRWNRVRPSGQPAEDVMVNTLHFQCTTGGLTSADADDFKTRWETFFTAIQAKISNRVGVAEIRLYNMPATAGPVGSPAFVRTSTLVGSQDHTTELPHQVAMTATFKTAVRRRWGRIYLPGFTSVNLADGRIISTTVDTVATALDVFGTGLRGAGTGLVIWHRASWTPQDVTLYRVDDVWDVQRRRRFDRRFYSVDGAFV